MRPPARFKSAEQTNLRRFRAGHGVVFTACPVRDRAGDPESVRVRPDATRRACVPRDSDERTAARSRSDEEADPNGTTVNNDDTTHQVTWTTESDEISASRAAAKPFATKTKTR